MCLVFFTGLDISMLFYLNRSRHHGGHGHKIQALFNLIIAIYYCNSLSTFEVKDLGQSETPCTTTTISPGRRDWRLKQG